MTGSTAKIRAGIVGGAGFTGGEMLRLLLNHPGVDMAFIHSNSHAGHEVHEVHTDLYGDTELRFSADIATEIDVLFLCVGHGDARKFLERSDLPDKIRIIDLSQDYRLHAGAGYRDGSFVYGLPETNREEIRSAQYIANPGCFATCIELALLPLAAAGKLHSEIHITGTTGSTGAGQSPSATTHFSWRNDNLSVYKAFEHQHLREVGQTLRKLQPDFASNINFIPYRGDYTRGIIASVYLESALKSAEALELYNSYYREHPFTHATGRNIDLKQVVNTNKCLLQLQSHEGKLLVISVIDNLLKGASGQAVQNMNLMFGFEETAGLRLKATAF